MTGNVIPFRKAGPCRPAPAPEQIRSRGDTEPAARLLAMLDWPPEKVPVHLRAHVEACRAAPAGALPRAYANGSRY